MTGLKWVRALGAVAILGIVVWHVGVGPFVDGVRAIDGAALAFTLTIGVLTTVCAAWRWRLVAGDLGVHIPLRHAVSAYYRSQFLNLTLPGGVVGDVHRAVRHGMDLGDVGLGVRAVVLERFAGQIAQVAFAIAVLAAFPSPVRSAMPLVAAIALAVAVVLVLVSRWVRSLRQLTAATWLGVLLTSAVVLFGHLGTFLVAARVAGATAPLAILVPLTLFALFAMAVPLNVAGWGLREGAAAWAFGAAGLTTTLGVTTAVTYGVLALVSSLPGACLLFFGWVPGVSRPALGEVGLRG